MRLRTKPWLLLALLSLGLEIKAASFLTEKDVLSSEFICSNEQNLPSTDNNSAVWICLDESGNRQIQISRRPLSLDKVDTLQIILITDNNQQADVDFVALSQSIATKYAKQNSSDIVNIIKNCQQKRNFQAEVLVDAGCIKGPLKTERYVIVRMNSKK